MSSSNVSVPAATPVLQAPNTLMITLASMTTLASSKLAAIQEFVRTCKLIAVLTACVHEDRLTTYKPVALASDWGSNGHRNRLFHMALGELSRACIQAGGAAITAVVTSADPNCAGRPTKPGNEFYQLLEEERPGLQIPRDAAGNYTDAGKRAAWNDELARLGMSPR
jgi:hypothetical protein